MDIDVSNQWFSDTRRSALAIALGSQFVADGVMVAVWRLAQIYYTRSRSPIPLDVWLTQQFPDSALQGCGLVEQREDGMYVKGSEARFAWLAAKRELMAAKGRKSAEVRKEKYGSAVPVNASNENADPNTAERLSLSLKEKNNTPAKRGRPPTDGTQLLEEYAALLVTKSIRVARSAKQAFQAKRVVEAVGLEDAKRALRAFVADQDKFVTGSAYDFGVFESRLQRYLNSPASQSASRVISFEELEAELAGGGR